MGSFLKGNFKTKKEVVIKKNDSHDNLEARFEKKEIRTISI